MPLSVLHDGPSGADSLLVLAHGAGAGMDSGFMDLVAQRLACGGIGVVRFEFPYMQLRRQDGRRRPPDRMPVLMETFAAAVEQARREPAARTLLIGGKSMGGRVATMLADDLGAAGVVCLGYPFHPAGRPEKLRTAHLQTLCTPTLIIQGSRDPLGNREEIGGMKLADPVEIIWAEDGNHDLAPRRASGRTFEDNLAAAVDGIVAFVRRITEATTGRN